MLKKGFPAPSSSLPDTAGRPAHTQPFVGIYDISDRALEYLLLCIRHRLLLHLASALSSRFSCIWPTGPSQLILILIDHSLLTTKWTSHYLSVCLYLLSSIYYLSISSIYLSSIHLYHLSLSLSFYHLPSIYLSLWHILWHSAPHFSFIKVRK